MNAVAVDCPQGSTWIRPTKEEKDERQLLVWLMRATFVLDGRKQPVPVRFTLDNMGAPDLPLDEDDPESPMIPVTRLNGRAWVYLGKIVRQYDWVGWNNTTTAEQAAINAARGRIRADLVQRGASEDDARRQLETRDDVLETLGQDEHPIAQAFSLAMVFWHHATEYLLEFIRENKSEPWFVGLAAALRQEYEHKHW
ncbi:MAG: hypothetical protein WBP12_04585 [Candidatus Saccharimonas sp.]